MKILSSPNKNILLMLLAGTILFNYSCKKNNDLPFTSTELTGNSQMQKFYGGNVSASFVTPINKAASEIYFKKANGTFESLGSNPPLGPAPSCTYGCFNAPSPSALMINYTLNYSERFYFCEYSNTPPLQQSNVRVKWTVQLPTVPEVVAGTNNIDNTWMIVKFLNTNNGTTQTFTIPASAMQGKSLGQVPNCANAFLYEITGVATLIPDQYFQNGWQMSVQLSLDIFCQILGYVAQSSFVTAPAFSQNGYLPCNRVDKVFGLEGTNGPFVALGMSSISLTCTHAFGLQYADKHQLEYRQVNNSNSFEWVDQTSQPLNGVLYPGGGGPIATFNINQLLSLPLITQNSGWWLVRYRNVKTGTCNAILGSGGTPGVSWADDGRWVTEKVYY